MDGHPQATAVLFPRSLSQGFKEAAMRITLFHSFHLFLALWCIPRGGVLHIQVSAGDGDVLYGWRQRCLVWPEMSISCLAGDGDVLYGWRRRCLVWTEMVMSCMAGSVLNRPVRQPGTACRPRSCQDGRDGAPAVGPVRA
jgi:hypothetical protein